MYVRVNDKVQTLVTFLTRYETKEYYYTKESKINERYELYIIKNRWFIFTLINLLDAIAD